MKNTLIAILMIVSCEAFAENGNYQIYGSGATTCGSWSVNRKNGRWYDEGQWMLGAISAAGYFNVFNLKKSDSNSFALWMDNYCASNPLSTVSDGTYKLILELKQE